MKVILTNAAEAGMPNEMISHCEQLLQWRIAKLHGDGLPEEGADIEILYSEKDPLQQSEEVDDEAYMIYFAVSKVAPAAEAGGEDQVFVDLML